MAEAHVNDAPGRPQNLQPCVAGTSAQNPHQSAEEEHVQKGSQAHRNEKQQRQIPDDLKIIETNKFLLGRKFHCPWGDFQQPGIFSLLDWKFNATGDYPDLSNPPNPEELQKYLPNTIELEKIKNPPREKLQVTWIGHSTVLVQLHGVNILTDPVFCNTCGPVDFEGLGYTRYSQPACKINELPDLDVVIISHDHYDHLDKASVEEIQTLFPKVRWILPKGVGNWFIKKVCKNSPGQVKQLTWWEEHEETFEIRAKTTVPITFVCTPAQHWCGRLVPKDKNERLWCTWVVKSDEQSFYFAGDTGYHAPLFKKIGELYGPFSLAAIPIGAYEPRKITEYQHSCPIDSVEIHRDVKAEYSVAIHWGAFVMTNEYFAEPPRFLEEVMKHAWQDAQADKTASAEDRARLDPSRFTSLQLGQTWVVGEDRGPRPNFMSIDMDDKFESEAMKTFRKKVLIESADEAIPESEI